MSTDVLETKPSLVYSQRLLSVEQLRRTPMPAFQVHKVSLSGLGQGLIAYNPTLGFFGVEGRRQLKAAIRVEPKDPDIEDSSIVLFDLEGVSRGEVFFGRNGIAFPGQDPKFCQVNGRVVIAYNETQPYPTHPDWNLCQPKLVSLSPDGSQVNHTDVAFGALDTKDAIAHDIGKGLVMIPRYREASSNSILGEVVVSQLQLGSTTPPEKLAQLSASLVAIGQDRKTGFDLMKKNPWVWYSAESAMPLEKKGPYENLPERLEPLGVLCHLGGFTNIVYPNGHAGRLYEGLAFEGVVDMEAGSLLYIGRVGRVGAVEWLGEYIPGKRIDINRVCNPRNLLVGIDDEGEAALTYLVLSINDREIRIARTDYPFNAPPKPEHNKHTVVPLREMQRLLPLVT